MYQLQAVSSVKSRAQQTNIAVSGSVGYKQVLDEVVVISRIIKVKVAVISGIPRLIALTETLIILDITKTKFEQKNRSHVFATSPTASNTKCINLT